MEFDNRNNSVEDNNLELSGLKPPSPYTPEQLRIIESVDARLSAEFADDMRNRQLGFCHYFWGRKKEVLKEEFGIDWKTPQEENPHILFD